MQLIPYVLTLVLEAWFLNSWLWCWVSMMLVLQAHWFYGGNCQTGNNGQALHGALQNGPEALTAAALPEQMKQTIEQLLFGAQSYRAAFLEHIDQLFPGAECSWGVEVEQLFCLLEHRAARLRLRVTEHIITEQLLSLLSQRRKRRNFILLNIKHSTTHGAPGFCTVTETAMAKYI